MCKLAGRPNKTGLDYFELDCHMDDKLQLIEAEYGLKGFAIVVKLYQGIYSGFGYYCEWTPDISLLWAARLIGSHCGDSGKVGIVSAEGALPGFPKNLINDVVAASIRRGIFSKDMFDKYHILTSSGIQKRYLNATSKRERVELKKEYLLVEVTVKYKNVVVNSISEEINSINYYGNGQSKVKESKEDKNNMCKADALALFECLWKLYPVKKGKGQVSDSQKLKLLRIGFDEMERAINRYQAELKKESWRKPQNGSTFFNSGYVDYLDANYVPGTAGSMPKGNKPGFCDFPQDDDEYDYEAIERSNMAAGSIPVRR